MKKIRKINNVYFLLLSFSYILNVFSKEFFIRNNNEFINLKEIIVENQNFNELILNFVDEYYDMTNINDYSVEINVDTNIIFNGNKNGTVFDYNYKCRGSFNLLFNGIKNEIIKFNDIIFKNFNHIVRDNVHAIAINGNNNHFRVEFNNCTFQNNNYLISISSMSNLSLNSKPNILLNKCNFYDNSLVIIVLYSLLYSKNEKFITGEAVECNFINNRGLFLLILTRFVFDKCYFAQISEHLFDKDEIYTLMYTKHESDIQFKNSLFEDINIETPLPLIKSTNLIMNIESTTFSNCKTSYGYLFDIISHNKIDDIKIRNSTFTNTSTIFTGRDSGIYVSDSGFFNITTKNTLPAITNLKYSSLKFENTEIYNMNISHNLFNEESSYILNNVKFKNIKSNSKGVLFFQYNNVDLINITIENISCNGDSGETSFILFDSGEEYKSLLIENLNAKSVQSNGSFIKIKGDTNEILIKNSNFSEIVSFGSIIENKSKKTKQTIYNTNIHKSSNNNKLVCGNIHFINDVEVLIENSNFINNSNEGNGGMLCINNASNIKLNLTSNIFKNNKAANGGGIYLGDNKNSLEENRNVIFIKNNTFLNNYANNFGGAVYFKLLNNYNTTIIDNNVISNAADISGGGMYSVNNQFKNDFILKNNNNFLNNTVNSYKSDYTSKPYSIGLNENYINQRNFNIITGDYLSIGFNLYDIYDKVIEDITEY